MPKYYALRLSKKKLSLELYLNDVPIMFHAAEAEKDYVDQLNLWVKPGDNRMTLRLDWASETGVTPGLATLQLDLKAIEQSTDFAQNPSIASFEWPAAVQGAEVYPYEAQINFVVDDDDAPPSQLWRSSTAVTLDDAARQELVRLAEQVYLAVNESDSDRLMQLLDVKAVDVGGSFYLPADQSRQMQREFFDTLFQTPGWGLMPWNEDAIVLTVLADNHVVLLSYADWQPIITSSNTQGAVLNLPLYFGKIKGEWHVIR